MYLKKFEEEVILYLEQWESREDFERHVRSSQYDRILAALDLARDPPEINFFDNTGLGGMEVIEAIRIRGTSPPSLMTGGGWGVGESQI